MCTTIRKCRIRPVASRYLKPDNMEIYITCGWDLRCRPDRPRGPPSLLYKGYRGFPRGKAAAAWCWSPTSFQCRVANGLELHLRQPCVPTWACHGVTFTFTWRLDLHCIYVTHSAMNYPALVRHLIVSNAPGYSNNRTTDIVIIHSKIAVVISTLCG